MTSGLHRLGTFETIPSESFVEWLAEADVALAFTRRNELVTVGRNREDSLRIDTIAMGRVGGMAWQDRSLWLATAFQVWRFVDALTPGTTTDDGHDVFLLPQVGCTTGSLIVDDLAVIDGIPLLALGRFSCLATLSETVSFRPLWMPAWISQLADDSRSPVTGVAVRDGECTHVTVSCTSDAPDGWHGADRATAGVLVDVRSDAVVARGLSMPYSPRWHSGRLWFCDAGRGRLMALDPASSELQVITELPTFARGLDFIGDFAIVAGSVSRSGDLFDGLPLATRLNDLGKRPEQGLWVIDTQTGKVVHRLTIDGTGREVFAVVAFPGVRSVGAVAPDDDELQVMVAYDSTWNPARTTDS